MDTNKAKATSKAKALVGEVIVPDEAPESAVAVVDNSKALSAIAKKVATQFGKGLDTQFAIGHLLNEARALLPGDTEFGKWVAEQSFGFSRPTAHRLQQAALREPEVREFIAARSAQSEGKSDISPTWAVQLMDKQADEEGRVPKEVQKRVQALFEEEPEPQSGFGAFRAAAEALNLQTLTVDELGEFASLIQTLVAGYGEERKRRSA